MGCSPSKGKLFSKPESPIPYKALHAQSSLDSVESRPIEDVSKCLETDKNEEAGEIELPLPTEKLPTNETAWSQLSSDKTAVQKSEQTEETVENETHQIVSEVMQTDTIKKSEKRKKKIGNRKSNEKQRKSSIIQSKLDFPPQMVRAHQAAYAFLNPNISKYETLMGLLDQAAQTHLSLEPMMSAFVLLFEEINQALEEIAEEGELMLKEHADYMALPSGMIRPAVTTGKPSNATTNLNDPPPDLLQQLLQQSTEKMRHIGGSAQALGDTTLVEAVDYFSSLSRLLFEKLQAKQAAEQRLTQVLAWVEGAAMKKSNPEDLALHSEDSGIGGENESLTGSDRHHSGSAGSGSCGSGVNIRGASDNLPNNNSNLIDDNEDDEEDEEDDHEDDEEDEDDAGDKPGRKRSNSSPPDPSQPLLYMHFNSVQDRHSTVKRPLTAISATKSEHFSSTIFDNIVMDLQKSQRDLDQRLTNITEIHGNKDLAGTQYNLHRSGLRRHSLYGSAAVQKGLRTNQSPCFLPMLAPQPPKQQSVRRLINTFSQGVDGRPGQCLANIPPHIRRSRKSEILLLSDTVNGNEGVLVINGNNNNNSWPDGRVDLDVENLPPPPPEVLMDNSFQRTEGMPGNEHGSQELSGRSLPVIHQKTGVSNRLKASIQNVEVLPNRSSVRLRATSISPARPVRQDALMGTRDAEQQPEDDLDSEMEKVNCLYQQARKIIHLRNAAEFPEKRNTAEADGRGLTPLQARMSQRCENNEFYESDMSCCLPVTAPPVSRVRLPPSCPTVRHSFPSPPVLTPQSTSRPSSRPRSPRTVIRATDNNTEEIIPLVSFHHARSVFCQNELLNSENCVSAPRPWGDVSRGRLSTRRIDNTSRRTQSEQRPGLPSHLEFSKECSFAPAKAKSSEPVSTKYR